MQPLDTTSGGKTRVVFLGTAAAVPEPGHDAASFIINGQFLVDTGWNAPLTLQAHGIDPLKVEYLFLTHCHHDHYLGLPSLLFYRSMQHARSANGMELPPLKIVGPAEDVERVVDRAVQFLQPDFFPEMNAAVQVIPLAPGGTIADDTFHLSTCPTRHPVQGLCYRFTDKRTGTVVAWTGDTAPSFDEAPWLADHVRGAALLIHDATFGSAAASSDNPYLHSGAPDAARLALAAGVSQLALIHGPAAQQEAASKAAREIFPKAFWPTDGQIATVE